MPGEHYGVAGAIFKRHNVSLLTPSDAGASAETAKAREADLKSEKEASDAKDRMLEAGAATPRDRDALADRLRDGFRANGIVTKSLDCRA